MFALLTAVLLAGCGGGAQVNIVPADAAKSILDNVTFRDSLVEAQGDLAKEWYAFDDKVTDYAVYVSGSGATAEEIAVIKTTDTKTARQTVEKRVEDLKFRFENYVPAEMTKLNSPVIVEKSGVVVLVIADDATEAQKAVDNLF